MGDAVLLGRAEVDGKEDGKADEDGSAEALGREESDANGRRVGDNGMGNFRLSEDPISPPSTIDAPSTVRL